MSNLTAKQEKFAQSIGSNEFDFDWMAYEKHYDTKKMSENEKAKLMKGVKRLKNMFASGRVTKIMLKTLSKIST